MKMNNKRYQLVGLFALASITMLALFYWQAHVGFNLADEGFLWYGAKRTLAGEVPIRDFMSYDPGRYYWSAVFMALMGDNGVMSLRGAVALFQGMGLFSALWVLHQSTKLVAKVDILFYLIAACVFVLWMFPRHKLFDISLSIFLVSTLTYLIKHPILSRYFVAGIFVGVVAVFGRNHGVYGAVASFGVIIWLQMKGLSQAKIYQAIPYWIAGVLVGFLPIICMMVVIPGFASAFVDSILFLLEQKSTNLPLPVPWPWQVDLANGLTLQTLKPLLVGIAFVMLLLFGAIALLLVLFRQQQKQPLPAAFVAAAFLILPYAHFAFSRADLPHLAQSIFPLLIGLLVLFSVLKSKAKWFFSLTLLVLSAVVMLPTHPRMQCYLLDNCVAIDVAGDALHVDGNTANNVAMLKRLVNRYAKNGENFIVAPLWPGAYAMFDRVSPMWEIYPLIPRTKTFERVEIERIKQAKPIFALVTDIPLDGQDALRFKNTHPLINQYILDYFVLEKSRNDTMYKIYNLKK